MTEQLERLPRQVWPGASLEPDKRTKGILTYGHCQVLNHPMALSKQTLWSLPGPWGTPAVKYLLQ